MEAFEKCCAEVGIYPMMGGWPKVGLLAGRCGSVTWRDVLIFGPQWRTAWICPNSVDWDPVAVRTLGTPDGRSGGRERWGWDREVEAVRGDPAGEPFGGRICRRALCWRGPSRGTCIERTVRQVVDWEVGASVLPPRTQSVVGGVRAGRKLVGEFLYRGAGRGWLIADSPKATPDWASREQPYRFSPRMANTVCACMEGMGSEVSSGRSVVCARFYARQRWGARR